jgi:hypothetical protein
MPAAFQIVGPAGKEPSAWVSISRHLSARQILRRYDAADG